MKNKVILSILLLSSFASTNISLCGNWFTPPTPTEQFFKTIKKFAKKEYKICKLYMPEFIRKDLINQTSGVFSKLIWLCAISPVISIAIIKPTLFLKEKIDNGLSRIFNSIFPTKEDEDSLMTIDPKNLSPEQKLAINAILKNKNLKANRQS